jgi:hypothetical protein
LDIIAPADPAWYIYVTILPNKLSGVSVHYKRNFKVIIIRISLIDTDNEWKMNNDTIDGEDTRVYTLYIGEKPKLVKKI